MANTQITIAKKERDPNAEPDTLTINGEVFTYRPLVSEFVLMELAESGKRASDEMERAQLTGDEPDGDIVMDGYYAFMTTFREAFEPESFERFFAMAKAEKWNTDDVAPIVQEVVAHIGARPTSPPLPSPSGPSTTSTSSTDADSPGAVAAS